MNLNTKSIFVLSILILAVGFTGGYFTFKYTADIKHNTVLVRMDTTININRQEPYQFKERADVRRTINSIKEHSNSNDTVVVEKIDSSNYKVPSFTALDTILTKHDSVVTHFYFPEMYFCHDINPKPDTSKVITQVFKDIQFVPKERALWIDIFSHAGALLVGGYLGLKLGVR